MDRQAKAVICREWGKPVQIEQITVEGPRRGQITIKVAACGVCHSDLSATTGKIQYPPPLVLGHEAAGVVVEVGEDRKSTRLNSSHVRISYAVFCLKKKND